MKKLFGILLAVVMMFSVVGVLAACNNNNNEDGEFNYSKIPDTMTSENGKYEIAFITDVGELMDKSFNQGTWEGLKRYASENNKSYKYYKPAGEAGDDDRLTAIDQAVENGAQIVVCSGFLFDNSIVKAIAKYPNVKFAQIDGTAGGEAKNFVGIIFHEEQAGYLAGYAAVKEGYTKLGFFGGMEIPAVQRYGYGYIQGAQDAAKELNTKVTMKYNYCGSFNADPAFLTTVSGWYNNGTEVVFSCGGKICENVFAAAEKANKVAIGVDVDQSSESEIVVTSAEKDLRAAGMLILDKFYSGKWDTELAGKALNLGAKEGAVCLPTTAKSWRFEKYTVADYNKLYQDIVDGKIKVDATVKTTDELAKVTFSNLTLDIVK